MYNEHMHYSTAVMCNYYLVWKNKDVLSNETIHLKSQSEAMQTNKDSEQGIHVKVNIYIRKNSKEIHKLPFKFHKGLVFIMQIHKLKFFNERIKVTKTDSSSVILMLFLRDSLIKHD